MDEENNSGYDYSIDDVQNLLGVSATNAHILATWLNAADKFDKSKFLNSKEAELFSDGEIAWFCENWGKIKIEGPLSCAISPVGELFSIFVEKTPSKSPQAADRNNSSLRDRLSPESVSSETERDIDRLMNDPNYLAKLTQMAKDKENNEVQFDLAKQMENLCHLLQMNQRETRHFQNDRSRSRGTNVREEHTRRRDTNGSPAPRKEKEIKGLPPMEIFDGKTNYKEFELQFMRRKRLCNWSDDEAIARFALCLKGSTVTFFNNLPEETQESLKDISAAFHERYGKKMSVAGHRSKFQNLTMSEKEDFYEFSDRVREAATEAYPNMDNTFIEQEMIRKFLLGCSAYASEAALRGLEKDYESLSDAVKDLVKYGENQRAIHTAKTKKTNKDTPGIYQVTHPQNEYSEIGQLKKEVGELKSMLAKLLQAQGANNQTNNQATTSTFPKSASRSNSKERKGCFVCGDLSHFKRDCPKRSPQSRAASNERAALNAKGSQK